MILQKQWPVTEKNYTLFNPLFKKYLESHIHFAQTFLAIIDISQNVDQDNNSLSEKLNRLQEKLEKYENQIQHYEIQILEYNNLAFAHFKSSL